MSSKDPSEIKPSTFVQNIVGKNVIVKLDSGFEYHGKITSLDSYLNLILENALEVVNRNNLENATSYGTIFLRGNNVYYISEA